MIRPILAAVLLGTFAFIQNNPPLWTASSGLSTATTLSRLVAAPAGTGIRIYVTHWHCSASVASGTGADQQCTLKYSDSGSNCTTNVTYLDGCIQPATGGCGLGGGGWEPILILPANKELCWVHSVAGSKIVTVTYYTGA